MATACFANKAHSLETAHKCHNVFFFFLIFEGLYLTPISIKYFLAEVSVAVTEEVACISSQLTEEVKETSKSVAGTSFTPAFGEDFTVYFFFVYILIYIKCALKQHCGVLA